MIEILINKIRFYRDLIKYCRKLGVTIGENCPIYKDHTILSEVNHTS